MNAFPWDTYENKKDGLKEWMVEYPNSSFIPKVIWPKKLNQTIFKYFRNHRFTKKLQLYHGSPTKFIILEPQHDYYGQRRFAAISCTINPYFALAFGLINRNIKNTKEVVLYKLNEEAVISEFQIGSRNARIAYDVLHAVKQFNRQEFQVDNYNYEQDRLWIFNSLKWGINNIKYNKLIETLKSYVLDIDQINLL